MQNNPWLDITINNLCASLEEYRAICVFNQEVAESEYKINIETLPAPYVGNPNTAEVILLQLNPGSYFPPGFLLPNESFEREKFPKLEVDNLKCMRHDNLEYPFYHLNPDYRLTGGFRYWSEKLKSFLHSERDYKKLSRKICCIQYFPYHSKEYRALPGNFILDSQRYNFELVKSCIKKKKTLIVMRKIWQGDIVLKYIPELKDYKNLYVVKNFRNPVLSQKNLPIGFKTLKKILN